jgi:hypothetical protein
MVDAYDERLLLSGPALYGRILVVILEPDKKEGVYYPVIARPASKKERILYRTNIGKSTLQHKMSNMLRIVKVASQDLLSVRKKH